MEREIGLVMCRAFMPCCALCLRGRSTGRTWWRSRSTRSAATHRHGSAHTRARARARARAARAACVHAHTLRAVSPTPTLVRTRRHVSWGTGGLGGGPPLIGWPSPAQKTKLSVLLIPKAKIFLDDNVETSRGGLGASYRYTRHEVSQRIEGPDFEPDSWVDLPVVRANRLHQKTKHTYARVRA